MRIASGSRADMEADLSGAPALNRARVLTSGRRAVGLGNLFRTSRRKAACGAIAGLALLAAPTSYAESPDLLNDSFYLALGTFIINSDTVLRLDGEAGEAGTDVDWERTFGDGDVSRLRLDGFWRFAERHKIRALAFSSSRSASRTLNDEIEWGGEVYPVGAAADMRFKFAVYELAYEYAFMRRDNFELAGSLGVHYTDFDASIGATVTGPGGTTSERREKNGSVGAPLPVFGLRSTWAIFDTLALDASVQYFSLTYGDIEGSLQDYRIVLNWQPMSWLGLGIGYDRFAVDVDVDSNNFSGKMDWTYDGPMIFYSASF
jgi:hypothetical protein